MAVMLGPDPSVTTVGLDEAGRGALAGPVVAAAVRLDPARPIVGLDDSKKLSAKQRETLARQIKLEACDWALGMATAAEVDHINVLQASMLAMRRAFLGLESAPQLTVVDGDRCPDLPGDCRALIGGDGRHTCIAAASILAKVARDSLMMGQEMIWPGYGFARHKGYGTAVHLTALADLGPCPQHRLSFTPVRQGSLSGLSG